MLTLEHVRVLAGGRGGRRRRQFGPQHGGRRRKGSARRGRGRRTRADSCGGKLQLGEPELMASMARSGVAGVVGGMRHAAAKRRRSRELSRVRSRSRKSGRGKESGATGERPGVVEGPPCPPGRRTSVGQCGSAMATVAWATGRRGKREKQKKPRLHFLYLQKGPPATSGS